MSKKAKLLFAKFAERPIAYYPVYARICGSVTAGLLLSQLVYWDSKTGGNEFYKSDRELQEELSMGRYEVQNAKKRLKNAEFISYTRKKHPATTHYKIDKDLLINELTRSVQLAGNQPTASTLETNQLVVRKQANKLAGNQPTIYKEVHRLPETTAYRIFEVWNSQKIICHKEFEKFESCIRAKLKIYSEEEIIQAIKTYKEILESSDYFFSYRWTLDQFLNRKNGLERFLDRKAAMREFFSQSKSNGYRSQAEINSASSGQVVL